MSDPILPVSVASQHLSNDSTISSTSSHQPQPLNPSSNGSITPVTSSEATALGVNDDIPYEYPAMHPPKFPVGSYLSYVKRVAENSPILQAVFRPCLNPDKVDVMILDIKEDWTCSRPYVFGESKSINEYFGPDPAIPRGKILGYSSLKAFLELPKPTNVFVRLFLVEDLSPAMIEVLGSTLNLDPHFFAGQIVGTNYTLEGHKDPVEIRDAFPTMPYLLKPKAFFSSMWKRSALRHSWSWDDDSLDDEGSKLGAKKPRQYNNMHRSFDAIGEHLISRESKTAVAVEERISFLRQDNGYGWTGVILFDPAKESPGDRFDVFYNYSYRNIRSTPCYQGFDGSTYGSEFTNEPRTRNQVAKFITSIKETVINNTETKDSMDISSSSSFLNLLFHFMVNDWSSVLREMDKFLDEVDTFMSDNNMLQKKLVTWRVILGSWRKNLVSDSEKIRTTLAIIEQHNPGKFKLSFQEILDHVESLKDRTERTFGALMSSMAIVESQRAISQAESISRLTELAFFFIPLGFATSTFGMQLQGWSENYRPSQFIILSICLVLGSYTFRIIVRSRVSQHAIEQVPDKVRTNSRIPPGAHIPTLGYLQWFAKRLWKVILLAAISATSLALIWTLARSKAVRIGTTVMVCLIFGAGLVVIFFISRKWKQGMAQREWFQLQENKHQMRENTRHVEKIV